MLDKHILVAEIVVCLKHEKYSMELHGFLTSVSSLRANTSYNTSYKETIYPLKLCSHTSMHITTVGILCSLGPPLSTSSVNYIWEVGRGNFPGRHQLQNKRRGVLMQDSQIPLWRAQTLQVHPRHIHQRISKNSEGTVTAQIVGMGCWAAELC